MHQKRKYLEKKREESAVLESERSNIVSLCSCQHFGQIFRFSAMLLSNTGYTALHEAFDVLSPALEEKKHNCILLMLVHGAGREHIPDAW